MFASAAAKISLIGLTLLCASLPATAGLEVHDHDCSYEVGADVSLEAGGLRLLENGGRVEWRIADGALYRDGRPVELSTAESAGLREYQAQMGALLPLVSEIAIEGAGLGIEAAVTALGLLSGDEDSREIVEFRQRLNGMLARLGQRFDGRHLYAEGIDAGFEKALDAEIDAAADELAERMMGGVFSMIWMGLFNHDEMEQRAARLEREMEARVEARADVLEHKAARLCPMMARIDELETGLGRFDAVRRED